jgi:hypothetical protein
MVDLTRQRTVQAASRWKMLRVIIIGFTATA